MLADEGPGSLPATWETQVEFYTTNIWPQPQVLEAFGNVKEELKDLSFSLLLPFKENTNKLPLIAKVGKDCEPQNPPQYASGNGKWYNHFGNRSAAS